MIIGAEVVGKMLKTNCVQRKRVHVEPLAGGDSGCRPDFTQGVQ